MIFTSLNDLYFFAVGVHALNLIVDIAVETKLIVAPVITFVVSTLIKGMEGEAEDRAGMLKKLEVGVYSQVFVILVAFWPMVPLELDSFALYTKQCEGIQEPEIDENFFTEDGPARDLRVLLSGDELRVPLLIGLAYSYGTGFSVEAVDSLPCGFNLEGAKSTLLDSRISDQMLNIETKEFINQCYQPAKKLAFRNGDTGMPWIDDPQTESQPWPGHEAFMNDAYYGNVAWGFYSTVLLPGWQGSRTNQYVQVWVESRQAEQRGDIDCNDGQCLHQIGGFPSCREWWQGVGEGYDGISTSSNELGLRNRLWENLPEEDKEKVWPLLQASFSDVNTSDTWYQDKLLEKAYFNTVSMSRIQNADVRDYGLQSEGVLGTAGGWLNRLLGTAGNALTAIPEYAQASLVQLAAPMVKGAVILVLLVAFPLMLLVNQFGLKVTILMGALFVSVLFWPFFWELTILIQKSYIETVADNSRIPLVDLVTSPNIMLISQRLTDALFIAFPVMITSLLSVAGLTIGNAMGAASGLGSGAGNAGKAGAKAGGKFAGKLSGKGAK